MRISPFAAFQGVENDPAHSPSASAPDGVLYGLPAEISVHRATPNESADWRWGATADRSYLDPAIGGQGGTPLGVGWTTGLRPRKERRAPLDGRTLVVKPGQANNPNTGQVGRDTFRSDLVTRVEALNGDYLPSQQAIAASFTGMAGHRGLALQREILAK